MKYISLLGALIALLGGCCLATQASLNGALSLPLASGLAAASFSFYVGSLALGLFSCFTLGLKPKIIDENTKPVTKWMWGSFPFLGAYFVTCMTFLGPQLGFSLLFVCIIVGQLITSLIIDHFGFLEVPKAGVTIWKISSFFVVLAGVIMTSVDRLEIGTSIGLTLLFIVLSVLAGILIVIQGTISSSVVIRTGILPHRIAFLVFLSGMTTVSIVWGFSLIVDTEARSPDFSSTEWWMYFGGLLGATYVCCTCILITKIGAAVFFISVVTGQLTMSLVIDSFGLYRSAKLQPTVLRICGVALVLVGAIAFRMLPINIRKLQQRSPEEALERATTNSEQSTDKISDIKAIEDKGEGSEEQHLQGKNKMFTKNIGTEDLENETDKVFSIESSDHFIHDVI